MRARLLGALVVMVLVAQSPVAAGAADFSEVDVQLPFAAVGSHQTALRDMIYDTAHGHLFVSGFWPPKITELSESGQILKTARLNLEPGGLAIVGNTLYIGSCSNRTITMYVASTFAPKGAFKVASGTPCLMAAVAGRLWYSADQYSVLHSVTIGSTHTTTTYATVQGGRMAVVRPSTLYTLTSSTLTKLDVSGSQPVVTAQVAAPGGDVAVAPDGSIVAAAGGIGAAQLFDGDLNPIGTTDPAQGVAFAPQGGLFATLSNVWTRVYPADNASPQFTVETGSLDGRVAWARHIAFSADGSHLYVVSETVGQKAILHTYTVPPSPSYATSLSLQDQTIALGQTVNQPIGIGSDPIAGATGRTFHADLVDPSGNEVAGASIYTAGGATYVETPALNLTGEWQLSVTVDPDGPYRGDTAVMTITVTGAPTTASISASKTADVVYKTPITLTARLSDYSAGVTPVRIYRKVGRVRTLIGSGVVNASGTFSIRYAPTANADYYAEHPSDDTYSVEDSTPISVSVVPIVRGSFSRHRTRRGWAVFTYHASCVSNRTGCPTFTVRTIPVLPRNYVRLYAELHTRRGWKAVALWAHKLNRRGRWTFTLRYANRSVIGAPFRLVVETTATRTGTLESSTWGYWYFTFAR